MAGFLPKRLTKSSTSWFRKQPKTEVIRGRVSAYQLRDDALRAYLTKRFPSFKEKFNITLQQDYYIFEIPVPLTDTQRMEIIQLREGYED